MENEEYTTLKPTRRTPLAVVQNACMTFEHQYVAHQVRLTHLAKKGRICPYTEQLLAKITPLKQWADNMLIELIETHPAFWWFSHVSGCGRINIAKLIGAIEDFGRYYEVGDPRIPPEITRDPEEFVYLDDSKKPVHEIGIWVAGIERLTLPSKQRVYLGHAPHLKRRKGQKLPYNTEGKMLLWRMGTSLVRAAGPYYRQYKLYKGYLEQRLTIIDGRQIIATPKERYCPECEKEVVRASTTYCPDCGTKLSLKEEWPGVIFKGHVDLMARRRMQQLFSDHLNVIWRRSLGLPVREKPYPVEYLGHSTIITPESMMDKVCGKKDCEICRQYGLI